jgi:type IV secretory pathway VirB3-like protein
VHKALHHPLLVFGVERRLFGMAAMLGAVVFQLANSLLLGASVFAVLYLFAWWATTYDTEMLRFVCSKRFDVRYDPGHHARLEMEVR